MARGDQYGAYVLDNTQTYAMKVANDKFADAIRGWATPAAGTEGVPRGVKVRKAMGVSLTTGRRGSAVIATTGAPIWLGTATTFDIVGNDGSIDTLTVTSLRGELNPVSH